jgi:hypothetical protein
MTNLEKYQAIQKKKAAAIESYFIARDEIKSDSMMAEMEGRVKAYDECLIIMATNLTMAEYAIATMEEEKIATL